MGLSASQARLLSITARLTNNEYEAQQITNCKNSLSSKSAQASADYINALKATKLEYNTYDSNNNEIAIDLTHTALYDYKPLKSQYALINSANQILVSSLDAKNYKETDNLADFLKRYNLLDEVKNTNNDIKREAYNKEYEKYLEDKVKYDEDKAKYDKDKTKYDELKAQYDKDYEEYLNNPGNKEVYDNFVNAVGTYEDPRSCYSNAIDGSVGCYLHLLACMIDYTSGTSTPSSQDYKTSTGENFHFPEYTISSSAIYSNYGSDMSNFVKMSTLVCAEDPAPKCDGDDDYQGEIDKNKTNKLKDIIEQGGTPSEIDYLTSDYKYDSTTNSYSVKTLKEKGIDIAYLCQKYSHESEYKDSIINTIYNFTDGDLKSLTQKPERPQEPVAPIPPTKPQMPKLEDEYLLTVIDKDKAQWYTNLWFRMNGGQEPDKIKTKEFIDDNGDLLSKNVVELKDFEKDIFSQSYKVLDKNLAISMNWLRDSVKDGIISMEKIGIGVNSTKTKWSSIVYSDMTELTETTDDNAITLANAKYEQAVKEIEIKEKRYSDKLRKLDTEHNALQNQYESTKSAMNENAKRSFTTFKG